MSDKERNYEHRRAEYAFECIDKIAKLDKDKQKKYRTAALSCGALMQKSGLVQVMAYYLSKKEMQRTLAEHILRWIMYKKHDGDAVELFNLLIISNDEVLVNSTMEAQAIAKWLKRFAEGRLQKNIDGVDPKGNGKANEERAEKIINGGQ